MSASIAVLDTDATEALVVLALLAALTRANDDVLAVDGAPGWLGRVCGVCRVRLRHTRREGVFDAIAEHTRLLVVRAPDAELLEALVALGPPVLALGPSPGPSLGPSPGVDAAAQEALVLTRVAGRTRLAWGAHEALADTVLATLGALYDPPLMA